MNVLLTLSCPNRPGIVAAVTTELFRHGGDIREANQFDDSETGRFFTRIVFELSRSAAFEELKAGFDPIAQRYDMTFELRPLHERRRALILLSKFDHCLVDLLYRQRIGELGVDIVGIVSNHPRDTYVGVDMQEIPYHYLPVTPATKQTQEAKIRAIFDDAHGDLIVLARYMQILSSEFAAYLSGRCINIHHSFLPGFKGAKPYHQAHARGVKLIGATAHFVTRDLDEGPIIEQDVERISHNDSPEKLIQKGRDIERRVLAKAVALHAEGRVLMNGAKTIVFRD